MQKPFTFKIGVVWWAQVMILGPAILAAWALIGVLRGEDGALFALGVFGIFATLGLLVVFSSIVVTDEHVTVRVFYGRFRIAWEEVQKIIIGHQLIALEGNNKRVVLARPYMGSRLDVLLPLFYEQKELRDIEVIFDTPIVATHWNSRL